MTEEQYQLVLKACRIAQSQGIAIRAGAYGAGYSASDPVYRLINNSVCAIGAVVLGETNNGEGIRSVAAAVIGDSPLKLRSFIFGFDGAPPGFHPYSAHYLAGRRMRAELQVDQPTTDLEPTAAQLNP